MKIRPPRTDRRRYYAYAAALPPRTDIREDGENHVTPVVAIRQCGDCGRDIPQHATGRPREFCDPTCRKRKQRNAAMKAGPK